MASLSHLSCPTSCASPGRSRSERPKSDGCRTEGRATVEFSALLHVQAALALRGLFPPPAGRALVFTGADAARARLTADRPEAVVVERVVGHAFAPDVLPHLRRAPPSQGVELQQPARAAREVAVELEDVDLGPGRALIAALPRGPGAQRCQRALQRLDLAD